MDGSNVNLSPGLVTLSFFHQTLSSSQVTRSLISISILCNNYKLFLLPIILLIKNIRIPTHLQERLSISITKVGSIFTPTLVSFLSGLSYWLYVLFNAKNPNASGGSTAFLARANMFFFRMFALVWFTPCLLLGLPSVSPRLRMLKVQRRRSIFPFFDQLSCFGDETNSKLDPVGSTVRYEMIKLCTGSIQYRRLWGGGSW